MIGATFTTTLIILNCIESISLIDAEAVRALIVPFHTTSSLTNLICLRSSTLLHRELAMEDLGLIINMTWDYANHKSILTVLTIDLIGLSPLIIPSRAMIGFA